MQVEIAELRLKYAEMRVPDRRRQARLSASLAEHGQQCPVLVVRARDERPVLIDGYLRVAALQGLARDLVEAAPLELPEAQALMLKHHLERARRRPALEDAWLLHELIEQHGLSQQELAVQLDRSPSWVSRHLALVRVLPPSVQEAVRRELLPPQAASKHLVPLARANPQTCERLVQALHPTPVSVRQVEQLALGWREGDAEQRERILSQPHLYLKALEVVPHATPPASPNASGLLLIDLERVAGSCRRARERLRTGALTDITPRRRHGVLRGWREASLSFAALAELMEGEEADARPGHENGHPALARTGTRQAEDRPSAGSLPECSASSPSERAG